MNESDLQKIVTCVVAAINAEEERNTTRLEKEAATRSKRKKRMGGFPSGENGAAKGLQPGWERVTLTAQIHWINKLRDYAYTERLTLKEATDRMMESFLADKIVQHDPSRE